MAKSHPRTREETSTKVEVNKRSIQPRENKQGRKRLRRSKSIINDHLKTARGPEGKISNGKSRGEPTKPTHDENRGQTEVRGKRPRHE